MRVSSMREVFARVERTATWEALAAPGGVDHDARPRGAHLPAALATEGVTQIHGLLSPARACALGEILERIEAQGLPALFAYVLDAFWEPLDRLVPLVEAALGPVDVLADAWAWHIPPGPGRAGWPPHRGTYELVRGLDGRPGLVNVWVALSEVSHATACMHVVPFSRDPGYPDALRREPLATTGAVAYEMAGGDALLWDANSIHWGGPMLPGAPHARTSFSYTLRARSQSGASALAPFEVVPDWRRATLQDRLDLVAVQLLRYGHMDPLLGAGVMEWARTLVGLRALRPRAGARAR